MTRPFRADDKTEWDCEECGIHVIACIPQPGETTLCAECRFVAGIEDEAARKQAEEWLKNKRATEHDNT